MIQFTKGVNNLSNDFIGSGSFQITPSDNTVFNGNPPKASYIYVGSGGNVKVRFADGTDMIYPGVPTGGWLVGVFDKVYLTGTTASALIGHY